MAKFQWNEITKEDVIKAISKFESENPSYPEPRSTFLIYDGKKYPAKHIRGMAYRIHFGHEISKGDFAGGQETKRFFERLGFDVQYTHKSIKTHPVQVVHTDNVKKTFVPESKQKMEEINPAVNINKNKSEKISIPTKHVIEQKNALQLILNKMFDGDVVCEKTYPWMKTPSKITGKYKKLYNALSSYRGNKNFAKKNVMLRCDFVCESRKIIIEYDERQHFSEARRISLLSYPEVALNYDRELWICACRDIQAKDNQPKNRDEVRAYYDSARDIEAAKHGYKLIRIMHGQIDFEADNASEQLARIINIEDESGAHHTFQTENITAVNAASCKSVKIGLYLQTYELHGKTHAFNKAMDVVRASDIDILVLPEISFVPFDEEYRQADFSNDDDLQCLYDRTLELSQSIGSAIVICNEDRYKRIMCIYANAFATERETRCKNYIKHTMTGFSACEIGNYREYAEEAFQPIIYKGIRIGLTICYDCNHSIFSRKYGQKGVDIILNCTGGDVVYNKWFKYNKVRAIENECFTFVTMAGDGTRNNPHNYVYGFTPYGKEMSPILLNGTDADARNISGGIYVYDTATDDGIAEIDSSINQKETKNKKNDIYIPENDIDGFVERGQPLVEGIRVLEYNGMNIVMCIVPGENIMKPEKVLKLLYEKKLKDIRNKRYIIINQWNKMDSHFYQTKLSVVLKVRSMENYCAVIFSSDNITKCFQSGQNRSAQVVKSENGQFGIDLARTGGPETIWRNKVGTKACWRDNIEWLLSTMCQ